MNAHGGFDAMLLIPCVFFSAVLAIVCALVVIRLLPLVATVIFCVWLYEGHPLIAIGLLALAGFIGFVRATM